MSGIWCVIPIKDLENAKTRLASALTHEERSGLFRAMAEDVLEAASGAPSLAGVLVLTNDLVASALAESYGARVEGEPENIGQSEAVQRAAELLAAEGADGVLTLPADAPLIKAADIESILARHPSSRPAMTIVPDHARRGSNCLVLTPGPLIPMHFGHVSFEPHLVEAAKLGLTPNILDDLPRVALDVDTPEDLAAALATGAECRARAFVDAHGIAAKLPKGQN